MHEEVIIAGFGGQGIVSAGQFLAKAAAAAGKNATFIKSYGPEMRGGTARCYVIMSDEAINAPTIENPDTLIVMNQPSFDAFVPNVKPSGLIIVNKSMINTPVTRTDMDIIYINATDIAKETGKVIVANVVVLGAYVARKEPNFGFNLTDLILEVITDVFQKEDKEQFIEINKIAFRRGMAEVLK